MRIIRSSLVLALVVAFGLSACGGMQDGSLLKPDFWSRGPLFNNGDESEAGLAALAKGDYAKAESHFGRALERDPRDVHALLGAGILYQYTGRNTRAREMYEAVLALRPGPSKQIVSWTDMSSYSVADVAGANLALLDGNGGRNPAALAPMPAGFSPGGATMPAQAGPAPMSGRSASGIIAAPSGLAMLGRQAPAAQDPAAAEGMPRFADADANIVSRFKTIKMLLDQGLVTQDEYNARRRANLGALLPLSAPPPGAGLDRPVPSAEQISGRLRAIGRALEMRAMTIAQHGSERSIILDALMPSAPSVVANPSALPQGMMEGADAVRRLEMLKAASLVTQEEYERERGAINSAMQPKAPPAPAASVEQQKAEEPAKTGPQAAVHLASYRSQEAADRGWAQLRRAHRSLLDDLKAEISRVDLGPGKGVFWRVKAGPLKDEKQAIDLCRKLKSARQFCEPAVMGQG